MKCKKLRYVWLICIFAVISVLGCTSDSEAAKKNKKQSMDGETISARIKNLVIEDDEELHTSLLERSSQYSFNTKNAKKINPTISQWDRVKTSDKKMYTIMIYMVGSDLESENQAATRDIYEILESGMDSENVNLIVYVGGAQTWWVDIPSNTNSYLVYDAGNDGTFQIFADEQRDMGESSTFADFINETVTKFPAEHYGLICWDHGGGPLVGYGMDEKYADPDGIMRYDYLSLSEMKQAMDNTEFKNKKLDFIGFDACLMGNLEVTDIWSDYADYFVGSAEAEMGCGWDYAFLGTLNRSLDTVDILKNIVDYYADYLRQTMSAYSNPNYTMCCYELSKTDMVKKSTEQLFAKINGSIGSVEGSEILSARTNAYSYGLDGGDNIDLVDLIDFSEMLDSVCPSESDYLNEAINGFVIYGKTNVAELGGISIYLPTYCKEYYEYFGRDELKVQQKDMPEYVSVSRKLMGEETIDEVSISDGEMVHGTFADGVYSLSDDEYSEFAYAYYNVFYSEKSTDQDYEEYYIPLVENIPLALDKDGNLEIDFNPDIVIIETDNFSNYGFLPVPVKVSGIHGKSIEYTTLRTQLRTNSYHEPFIEWKNVTFSLKKKNETSKIKIKSIVLGDDEEDENVISVNGKSTVSADNMGSVGWMLHPWHVNSGVVEEVSDGIVFIGSCDFDENFNFSTIKLSELKNDLTFENCYYQMIIVGRNDEILFSTEFVPIINDEDNNIVKQTVKTENGEMTFLLHDYYAELYSYNGGDTELIIPDEVEGIPVTKICSRIIKNGSKTGEDNETIKELTVPNSVTKLESEAFAGLSELEKISISDNVKEIPYHLFGGSYNLKDIKISDKVTLIGAYAFAGTGITQFEIPKSVKTIGSGAFSCPELKELTVNERNRKFIVEDGVLFSADRKRLVQFPAALERNEYTVPDGVEIIETSAFPMKLLPSERLTKIVFPDSLKRIENYAFMNNSRFDKIIIPDSVEYIGAYAFGSYGGADLSAKITIGKGVKEIGYQAFGAYKADSVFEVSKDNLYYASTPDGKLTNRNGSLEMDVLEKSWD